jgi:hypothetical protein
VRTHKEFRDIFERTRLVRLPKHRLATFGATDLHYSLITPLSSEPPRSALRLGRITAERPKIITADSFRKHFEGFGPGSELFEDWLKDVFSDAFRGLQYSFKNTLEGMSPHHTDTDGLLRKVLEDLDRRDVPRAAVIVGPEEGWPLALMKLIMEELTQSFPANVRELEERGLFDPAQTMLNRRRREVELLFSRSVSDPSALDALAKKLKEYDLFDEYQDRFFSLVKQQERP